MRFKQLSTGSQLWKRCTNSYKALSYCCMSAVSWASVGVRPPVIIPAFKACSKLFICCGLYLCSAWWLNIVFLFYSVVYRAVWMKCCWNHGDQTGCICWCPIQTEKQPQHIYESNEIAVRWYIRYGIEHTGNNDEYDILDFSVAVVLVSFTLCNQPNGHTSERGKSHSR